MTTRVVAREFANQVVEGCWLVPCFYFDSRCPVSSRTVLRQSLTPTDSVKRRSRLTQRSGNLCKPRIVWQLGWFTTLWTLFGKETIADGDFTIVGDLGRDVMKPCADIAEDDKLMGRVRGEAASANGPRTEVK